MRVKMVSVAVVCWAVGNVLYPLTAQTSRSVKDGVYTEDQAKRGSLLYGQHCSACHGADLSGGDEVPALRGESFLANWSGLPLSELFERIRISMPADHPGTLNRQQNADILAYVLKFDNYPAGNVELPTQTDALQQIRFEASKQ
jgi:mono/diheme cytochrome c family protein